jgi:hypothetical protein
LKNRIERATLIATPEACVQRVSAQSTVLTPQADAEEARYRQTEHAVGALREGK